METGGPLNWGTIDNFDTQTTLCKRLIDKLTGLNDPRMQAVWFAPR